MKFLRLKIANYRGIANSEVEFGSGGITLIQGPNEVGKTSLGEAIGLLFEYRDSSKHHDIEVIRPVHQDQGPEIELQAESGPYAFTYSKRFYKKPETKLVVTRPKSENHTGREAHERAQAILQETLDINLWKALTIQQGTGIRQPVLTEQTSLSAALDRAAGGRPAEAHEESLFSRVGEEHSLYFTERGAEKKELPEARKRQADAKAGVAQVQGQIQALDQDIERAAVLQGDLGQLQKREEELTAAVAAHVASLEEINTLETALATARLRLESAQKSEQAVRRDKEARQALIDGVVRSEKTYAKLQEESAMSLSALKQAEEELKKAQAVFNESEQEKKAADVLAALRRADFDYYNNKLHLEQLRERKEHIDQARQNAIQAEEALARNKVDARALKAIQDAERGLLTANAQLETGAPNVLLRGLAKCCLSIDDVEMVLGKGKVQTLSVPDKSRLTIPGALEIEITAGSSAEGLARKVAEARRVLESACGIAGVANPAEARKAFEDRSEAARQVENKGRVEQENLRDLTYDDLEQKLSHLQRSVPAYLDQRPKKPVICLGLDAAKKEWRGAETVQQKTSGGWEAARESLDAARSVREGLNTTHQKMRVQFDLLTGDLKHAQENLEKDREKVPDDTLQLKLNEAVRAVASEETSVRSAEESLKARNPVRVKALAETDSGSLQTTRKQRGNTQTELIEVQTRLKINGEEGLYEKLQVAQTDIERIEQENQSLFRRADAARCLFEGMRAERDNARRAYVAPLKEKIEGLGRLIFDNTFQVELSEDLQIVSRTAQGVTVPFDQLSGGTKEQLSLIFRLACSMIVAKDGGTPLILDDALGYTDPARLRLMGAVLAKAAKECQIIIFTCVPDRYSNVGEATVVSLR